MVWLGSSKDDLKAFPLAARRQAGFELNQVQLGLEASDFKSMQTVGPGAYEIRVRDQGDTFRVFYVAKFVEAVYVLHAFQKKTRKTSQHDVELGRKRYRDMLRLRGTAD